MMLAFACYVSWIIDGDTFICRDAKGGSVHVRLAGIDAPELAGHCRPGRHCTAGNAKASLHSLIRLAKGREARCEDVGKSYDRVLAFCSIAGPAGTGRLDLACAQLEAGQAVRRYSFGPEVCRRR